MTIGFSGVLGQGAAIAVLKQALVRGRTHHAHLFAGPEGVGKRTTALAWAAALVCERRSGGDVVDDACGVCRGCVRVDSGFHPDVVVIEPDGRFIKIEQIRELIGQTRYRPLEAPVRVAILDRAEWLREEAANALLKTLEEPTGETRFVLVTSEPHRMLTTIRSRCQRVRFAPLGELDVEAILVASGVDAAEARTAAHLSGGSVARARRALESPLLRQRTELAGSFARLGATGAGGLLKWAEKLAATPAELPELLDAAMLLYRDALLVAAGVSEGRLLNEDVREAIEGIAASRGRERLLADLGRIAATRRLLEGNVNPRMAMENLLLDLGGA